MDKLTVTLKTVTPLFLGGADPNQKAELRAPSIKGALRFWYRAMKGDMTINELYKKESTLFGGTDDGAGQSKLLIIPRETIPSNSISKTNLPPHSYRVIAKGKPRGLSLTVHPCVWRTSLSVEPETGN